MKIINIPKKYALEDYNKAINKQVECLSEIDEVKSIYQIGGVSTPGISDIDLVVVFEDHYNFNLNPRSNNSDTANYLFTHGLYGASEKYFNEGLKFTFFHNYKLLHGENLDLNNTTKIADQVILKKQIALEFLFKMYVNLMIQKSYKTINLRSLFLHIKALPYDFEFLNIQPKELIVLVNQGVSLRNNWLDGTVSKNDIIHWFRQFYDEFESFLINLFKEYTMYASALQFKIAPNVEICNANNLGFSKKGFVFPDLFNMLDKKYFKALNKFNDFIIDVPLKTDAPSIVKDYFSYADEVGNYNKLHLPHFMTLTSSLKVYK
ncbi:hypothetical protein [Psychroserpens sp. S379A]|uniref:hypothetical protein n=1 Tax=Psychroserpens sp. S379A TaxID=3415137 RepID=UPI003C7E01A7